MSKCPQCAHTVTTAAEAPSWLPFCSARCQKIDLGKWLLEDYRIAGPLAEEEDLPEEDEHD